MSAKTEELTMQIAKAIATRAGAYMVQCNLYDSDPEPAYFGIGKEIGKNAYAVAGGIVATLEEHNNNTEV